MNQGANIPFAAATRKGPLPSSFTLPAFSHTETWTGVSRLAATYALNNTQRLSLRLPLDPPEGDYVLVAKYVEDGDTYQYKLTDTVPTLTYPVYAGETLGPSAVIEVWTALDGPAASTEDFVMYTSLLAEPADDLSTCASANPVNTILVES